jgi:hypothetical protein
MKLLYTIKFICQAFSSVLDVKFHHTIQQLQYSFNYINIAIITSIYIRMQIIKDINNYLLTNTRKKRKLWFIQKEPFWDDICIEFNRLRLPDTMQLQQKIWHVLNDTTHAPSCMECGKPAKWQNSYGEYGEYGEFCNIKCSSISDIKKQRSIDTYFKKHGVMNPFSNKEVKEKIKQTTINRYGVDNISKTRLYKRTKSQYYVLKLW